ADVLHRIAGVAGAEIVVVAFDVEVAAGGARRMPAFAVRFAFVFGARVVIVAARRGGAVAGVFGLARVGELRARVVEAQRGVEGGGGGVTAVERAGPAFGAILIFRTGEPPFVQLRRAGEGGTYEQRDGQNAHDHSPPISQAMLIPVPVRPAIIIPS